MSQENVVQSTMQLNNLRRGRNLVVLGGLDVAVAATGVAVHQAVVQQTRSDDNERQQEARPEDQRQASGRPSERELV